MWGLKLHTTSSSALSEKNVRLVAFSCQYKRTARIWQRLYQFEKEIALS